MIHFLFLSLNLQRRKERGTFLLALGTSEGEMLVIDAFSGETKWKSTGHHSGYGS